jgi:hypothetical protein
MVRATSDRQLVGVEVFVGQGVLHLGLSPAAERGVRGRLREGRCRRLTIVVGPEAGAITATITFAIGLTKTFEVEHGGRGPGLDRGPTPDRARSRYRDIVLVAVIVLVIAWIEELRRSLPARVCSQISP